MLKKQIFTENIQKSTQFVWRVRCTRLRVIEYYNNRVTRNLWRVATVNQCLLTNQNQGLLLLFRDGNNLDFLEIFLIAAVGMRKSDATERNYIKNNQGWGFTLCNRKKLQLCDFMCQIYVASLKRSDIEHRNSPGRCGVCSKKVLNLIFITVIEARLFSRWALY